MKTTTLRAALLLLALAPFHAFAVYVSASGLGQALIYPYYTVRSVDGNAFNTYLTVVNSHASGKALRVRLRESRNGREVAGFNLFLEPYATWSAAVVPTTDSAQLLTVDPACVAPAFAASEGTAPQSLGFNAASFTGANADGLGDDAGRVREGYVEILEMGSFPGAMPSCDALRTNATGGLAPPQGYLYGMLTLINVQSGLDFTEPAVALANLATAAYFRAPADPYPDFDAAEIGNVAAFTRNDKTYRLTLGSGLAAVEAAMVIARMDNEIVLDAPTASGTDWVVTLPTRRFHDSRRASPWFTAAEQPDGAIQLTGGFRSRAGVASTFVLNCGAGCPANTYAVDIRTPYAANVLGFLPGATAGSETGISAVLGSTMAWNVTLPNQPANGALRLAWFNPTRGAPSVLLTASATRLRDGNTASEQIRLTGLPALGFMARTFRNGTLTCDGASCQGNYGGSATHRMRRAIDPANPDT